MNKLMQKIKLLFLDKPLPPITQRESDLIENLKAEFQKDMKGPEAMTKEWVVFKESLNYHVKNDNIRSFLRWNAIMNTMFAGNADYIKDEFNYLRNTAEWETKWSTAIIESKVGHPLPSVLYPASSGNLIHHAYHLAQFEEKTKMKIDKVDLVFEFGGGYGSMCRLFHNLGFAGNYVIFDLPPFSALQKFYLKSLSLPVQQNEKLDENNKGIFCTSDFDTLKNLLNTCETDNGANSLFIATWSLSEVPLELRNAITPLISNFKNLLIAYQDNAFGIDNVQYFKQFKEKSKSVKWHNWEIKHLNGHKYLVGSSR